MSETLWNPFSRNCPSRGLLDRIGDRWTVLVIGALDVGPQRFSQLQTTVDGVSQKMLSQTLRSMEPDGLVTRTVYPEVPPRVEYALTPKGEALIPLVDDMRTYGKRWLADEAKPVATAA